MNNGINIQYLPHQQIDKTKWDECICNASNGLIYGYSFYLDHMARQWDALVLGDYEMVMPLTWNKKFGIRYLYQPFLTAELGIFGNSVTEIHTNSFLQAIPRKFKLIEISLNSTNILAEPTRFQYLRTNYVLSLDRPYDDLYNAFRDNVKRNIRKGIQLKCSVQKDFDPEKVIDLAWQQMKNHSKESGQNVERFRKLYEYLHTRKMAITYGIFSNREELLASCVFFFSHSRAYYILVGNHPNGRTLGASHTLIDAFIKEHAGSGILLDFEGSDVQSLAFFYSSFGAKAIQYPAIRINRLPFYLSWLKRQ